MGQSRYFNRFPPTCLMAKSRRSTSETPTGIIAEIELRSMQRPWGLPIPRLNVAKDPSTALVGNALARLRTARPFFFGESLLGIFSTRHRPQT